jgi:hypothetical protein
MFLENNVDVAFEIPVLEGVLYAIHTCYRFHCNITIVHLLLHVQLTKKGKHELTPDVYQLYSYYCLSMQQPNGALFNTGL